MAASENRNIAQPAPDICSLADNSRPYNCGWSSRIVPEISISNDLEIGAFFLGERNTSTQRK